MNTLFDKKEFAVQLRLNDGTYCSKRTHRVVNELRWCLVGELRRQKCVSKLLRQKDEEIIRLKQIIRNFAEQDKLSNLF